MPCPAQDASIQRPKQPHRQIAARLLELIRMSKFNILICLSFPFHQRNETNATQRLLLEMIVAPQDHGQLLTT